MDFSKLNPYAIIDTYDGWLEFLTRMSDYCTYYYVHEGICRMYCVNVSFSKKTTCIYDHGYHISSKNERIDIRQKGDCIEVISRSINTRCKDSVYVEYPINEQSYKTSWWCLYDHHNENIRKLMDILSIHDISYLYSDSSSINSEEGQQFKREVIGTSDDLKFRKEDGCKIKLITLIDDFIKNKSFYTSYLPTFLDKIKDDEEIGWIVQDIKMFMPYIRSKDIKDISLIISSTHSKLSQISDVNKLLANNLLSNEAINGVLSMSEKCVIKESVKQIVDILVSIIDSRNIKMSHLRSLRVKKS